MDIASVLVQCALTLRLYSCPQSFECANHTWHPQKAPLYSNYCLMPLSWLHPTSQEQLSVNLTLKSSV